MQKFSAMIIWISVFFLSLTSTSGNKRTNLSLTTAESLIAPVDPGADM